MRDKELRTLHLEDIKGDNLLLVEFISEADERSASYIIDLKRKRITDIDNDETSELDPVSLMIGGIVLRGEFISYHSKFNGYKKLI